MSKHWFFWFRIIDQDLTSSPGTFLHGNSLFLPGSEPHNFSHSSSFPSVSGRTICPNVHCDNALLCRPLQQAVHDSNIFTCLNWCSLPEKLSNFFIPLCEMSCETVETPLCLFLPTQAPGYTSDCSSDPGCTCVCTRTVQAQVNQWRQRSL